MSSSYSINHPACIVCQSDRWKPDSETTKAIRTRFSGASVHRCAVCGQGILLPLPDERTVQQIYDSSEYAESYDAAGEAFAISGPHLSQQLAPRFEILHRLLPQGGRMLDVGASRGFFLAEAKKRGWHVQGLEASPECALFAKENFGIPMFVGSLESIPLPESTYDCIHLSHVLEHLREPQLRIQQLLTALKPGGVLVIEVPYEFGDLFDRIREVLLRRPRPCNSVPSTHLHFFTLRTLTRWLRNLGLKIEYAATPRRNQSYSSRLPCGRWIKSCVYYCEARMHLGPLIEVYARKPR